MEPSRIRRADEVGAHGRALLGADPARCGGVVQPIATWLDREGGRYALRIRATTPRSENDFFLLNLARARSEAILTTGGILREEPNVTHALGGPGKLPEALAAWRRDTLGLREPPLLLVLSGGRGLDPEHPAFRASARPVLFVPEAAAPELESTFGGIAEVVGSPATGSREAIGWLRAEGLRRITVEAGPTASRNLYSPPSLVDEVWRSTYLEHELLGEVIGPRVEDPVASAILETTGAATMSEPSGDWRFERLVLSSQPA